MANLTISVDERVLKRARIKGIERGVSVNRVLSEYLEAWVGMDPAQERMMRFLERARRSTASSGGKGRTWTRDELHER